MTREEHARAADLAAALRLPLGAALMQAVRAGEPYARLQDLIMSGNLDDRPEDKRAALVLAQQFLAVASGMRDLAAHLTLAYLEKRAEQMVEEAAKVTEAAAAVATRRRRSAALGSR